MYLLILLGWFWHALLSIWNGIISTPTIRLALTLVIPASTFRDGVIFNAAVEFVLAFVIATATAWDGVISAAAVRFVLGGGKRTCSHDRGEEGDKDREDALHGNGG